MNLGNDSCFRPSHLRVIRSEQRFSNVPSEHGIGQRKNLCSLARDRSMREHGTGTHPCVKMGFYPIYEDDNTTDPRKEVPPVSIACKIVIQSTNSHVIFVFPFPVFPKKI